MADFQTHLKIHGYKFAPPDRPDSVTNFRDLYRQTTPLVFSTPRVTVHDCRPNVGKEFSDSHLWEAFLSSEAIMNTYNSLRQQRKKPVEEDVLKKKPDKLLFKMGETGSGPGQFKYPRGLAVNQEGNIIIADTDNHRIQVFNQYGLQKNSFGAKGSEEGQFNQPSAVALFENEDIAVADWKNQRIQVFYPSGKLKYHFRTNHEPFSIACDRNFNVIVGTTKSSVEIYTRQGALQYKWKTRENSRMASMIWVHSSPAGRQEVILSDAADQEVKFFTYDGQLLYRFQPKPAFDSVVCHIGAVTVTDEDQILVPDTMNHTINLYSERGVLLEQVLTPLDECGSVQISRIGPEGHIITLEFTANGPHCVKIFRFRDCECHRTRPGSSKKKNETKSPSRVLSPAESSNTFEDYIPDFEIDDLDPIDESLA